MKMRIPFICLVGLTFLGMLIGTSVVKIEANDDLPPRPPTATPERPKVQVGAHILLSMQTTSSVTQPLWSVVQWQGASGEWHDVDGWRGEIVNGSKRWWVDEKDFGKGPYRWAVYQKQGNVGDSEGEDSIYQREAALWATSKPFHLPTQTGSSLVVFVDIVDP